MGLVVETGEGLINADAYCSIEQCDKYHYGMNNADWPQPVSATDVHKKEASIRKATLYIDNKYADYLTGYTKYSDQALQWPRVYCFYYDGDPIPDNIVPANIVKATMELALLVYKGVQLYANTEPGAMLTSKTISGVISKTWDKSTYGNQPAFGVVNSLLYKLFGPLSTSANASNLTTIKLNRGV